MSTSDAIIATFQAGLRHSLETKEHADLVLCCADGTTLNVHKVVLAGQSEFFRKALKPVNFKEGIEGRVDLVLGDSTTIQFMVNFMYCFDYDDKACSGGALLANAKMHEVADFYVMPHLKALAATKFLLAMQNEAQWKLKDFLAAVTVFYAAPYVDTTVRNSITTAIIDKHKVLVDDPKFKNLLSKTPELGKHLALYMLPGYGKLDKATGRKIIQYTCQRCESTWSYSGPDLYPLPACRQCRRRSTVELSG